MRLLLDTQVWLWWIATPDRLRAEARTMIAGRENQVLLSAVSALEIAIKHSIGKLTLDEPPETFVPKWMARTRVDPLPVEIGHALRVGSLPHHHRDPFDRLLIAQAQTETLPFLTADRQIASYRVEIIRAL